MFHIRAINLDYYMSKCITELYNKNDLDFNSNWLEPVIRIYGSTPDGYKSCVHVHGVYPYIYVPYRGGDNSERDALILGAALDKALKLSYNQHNSKFVFKVTLASGIPLYGYHSNLRQFFKIYFYNPFYIRKASELLLSGVILGQKLQPHEAHIPYVLQFMIDYNIYGMSFVGFSKVKYRRNPENPKFMSDIKEEDILSCKVKKMTFSQVEADVLATDITNRNSIRGLRGNPGLQGIWESEKIRRRALNKTSQFTVEETQPRLFEPVLATELMHRERLTAKLMEISTEKNRSVDSGEPELTYPAEVSDECNLLEASVLDDGRNPQRECSNALPDVNLFISEEILSQIQKDGEEDGVETEIDGAEAESILGKFQTDGEAEAELENDDGGDMTQPLNSEEDGSTTEVLGSQHREEFWHSMADRILQVDGAQDSSSDSEVGGDCHRIVGFQSASSILSTLHENNLSNSLVSQTSPTFWSNLSPRMDYPWPTQNQEPWSWDKNEINFSDYNNYSPRNPSVGVCDFAIPNKTADDVNPCESLGNLFSSNHIFDNYSPMTEFNTCGNLDSSYVAESSTLTNFTPPGRYDGYSDINMNLLQETTNEIYKALPESKEIQNPVEYQVADTKCQPVVTADEVKKRAPEEELKSCKNTCEKSSAAVDGYEKVVSLTLKQYLKDFGEIVGVDLKNFSDQEMVVVEYKPFQTKTGPSKFLIKPLDKFLENWNIAEKRINEEIADKSKSLDESTKSKEGIIKDFNRAIKNLQDTSKLNLNNSGSGQSENADISHLGKNLSNQTVRDGAGQNSQAKVKKVDVRHRKGGTIDASVGNFRSSMESNRLKKRRDSDKKNMIRLSECKSKVDQLLLNNLNGSGGQVKKGDTNLEVGRETWKSTDRAGNNGKNVDVQLIDEINSCFEDYFKSIVKVNNSCSENSNNLFRSESKNSKRMADERAGQVPGVDTCRETSAKGKTSEFPKSFGSENLESLKFVAQLLSVFSNMSQTCEIPPLSITINIGNRTSSETAPIQLNLQPSTVGKSDGERETKSRNNKVTKNFKIQNVDGPMDGSSSSDESLESPTEPERQQCHRKVTRDWRYKSLNVVLQKSAAKRKRSGRSNTDDEDSAGAIRRDTINVYSQNQLKIEKGRLGSSKTERKRSRKFLKKTPLNLDSPVAGPSEIGKSSKTVVEEKSKDEPDIIYDSDDAIHFKMTSVRKKRKVVKFKSKKFSRKISDADVTTPKSCVEEIELSTTTSNDGVIGAENNAEDSSHLKGTRETERLDREQDTSIFENMETSQLEVSVSSLDKTAYKIPSKWDESQVQCKPATDTSNGEHLTTAKSSTSQEFDFLDETTIQTSLSGSPRDSYQRRINLPQTSLHVTPDTSQQEELITTTRTPVDDNAQFAFDSTKDCDWETSPENQTTTGGPYCYNTPMFSSFSSKIEFTGSTEEVSSQFISLTDFKVVTPKFKPPSRNHVQLFLVSNENIKEMTEVPFYSDPRDVTKAMEMGPLVLKVETNACVGLKPFKSSLVYLGTEDRRALLCNTERNTKEKFRHLLIADRDVTITPLNKPPSYTDIVKGLSSKKMPENEEATKPKVKIFVPLSPGQDSQSDEEMDVSLSMSTLKDGESQSHSGSPKHAKYDNESFSGKQSSLVELPLEESQDVPQPTEREGPSTSDRSNTDLFLTDVKRCSDNSFQIRGPTLENTYGFDNSVENFQDIKLDHTYQYVTMLVIEIHVQTRKNLRPDPKYDPIQAIFYTVTFDSPHQNQETGVIVVGDFPSDCRRQTPPLVIHKVSGEKDLLWKIVELMKIWDPDILAGYEIEMHSWGYLVQRGFILDVNLISPLGRVKAEEKPGTSRSAQKKFMASDNEESEDMKSDVRNMRITGRMVLDIWRVLRHEVALTSYSFENVMYHLSHERHPLISYNDLTSYWQSENQKYRHVTIDYYLVRVLGIVRILDRLDFINRTSEFARIFGIQFYEVLSRGSQFRVESMMLRLAKPLNYVPVSPSVAQRASMRAPASLPLILEPRSAFYSDPVIVLDFQSLYPSMIIAYNYCFSTCLGRVEKFGGTDPFEFGCTHLQVSPHEIKDLVDDITISPAGVAFVKASVRRGILPSMLEEILETRLMVKKSMKQNKNNKLLQKVLHAQQLGLKLIANVTYGYTAANFSGRMPCIEVGDSVVSKGRETLHRAIQMVKNNTKWGAKVVYGDTDSIFVLTPGKTRAEAFQIGSEIADAVTRDNPKPVKLKLEKVYHPCILQTKKRYVGYMYENPDQVKPTFEAKGIETVRRDGCPAVGKILQKALEILFETRDVSLVKKYTVRQFSKLLQGRINIQDLIFAKEYRGRQGYRPGACVPALELARQWTRVDKQAEPRVKERVPYVIVNGPPGVPLIKLVRSPMDLFADSSLRINAFYYITKAIIPPLHRCFSLVGVDVASWYAEMPKKFSKEFKSNVGGDGKKSTISQYFTTVECLLCCGLTNTPICRTCQGRTQATTVGLVEKIRLWERCQSEISKICQSCTKSTGDVSCQSLDCPVLFRKIQASRNYEKVSFLRELLNEHLENSGCEPTSNNSALGTAIPTP